MSSPIHDTSYMDHSMHTSPMYRYPASYPMELHPFPHPMEPPPRPKRRQVKNACTNCQRACKKCDDARPCLRCVKYGVGDECISSKRKERKKGIKRGPYKKRDVKNGLLGTSSALHEHVHSAGCAGSPSSPEGSPPAPQLKYGQATSYEPGDRFYEPYPPQTAIRTHDGVYHYDNSIQHSPLPVQQAVAPSVQSPIDENTPSTVGRPSQFQYIPVSMPYGQYPSYVASQHDGDPYAAYLQTHH